MGLAKILFDLKTDGCLNLTGAGELGYSEACKYISKNNK